MITLSDIVLIWSDQHKAWWRPEASGYTTCREEAGRYWLPDARNRVDHCGPEKRICFEVASPAPLRRTLEADKELREPTPRNPPILCGEEN